MLHLLRRILSRFSRSPVTRSQAACLARDTAFPLSSFQVFDGLPPGHWLPVDWHLPEAGATMLEVIDTGPGISLDIQEHLFEPFFTTRFQGRGLGLPSVLGIARTYGGAVEVASTPGQGATFRVLLP